tara:strand:+ start:1405 stop:1578 length:174 start_codon:yes stop_codon:yes gene_type:complete
MALYKLLVNPTDGKTVDLVKKDCGNNRFLTIPFVNKNTDYQEYLEWVAAGNTPEEAD